MIIVQSRTVLDVVKDYIAMEIICCIDDLMINTLSHISFGGEKDDLGLTVRKCHK
jgi:hypothetical protein